VPFDLVLKLLVSFDGPNAVLFLFSSQTADDTIKYRTSESVRDARLVVVWALLRLQTHIYAVRSDRQRTGCYNQLGEADTRYFNYYYC